MSSTRQNLLRLGTRASRLARAQSQLVADQLMNIHNGLRIDLVPLNTSGDAVQNQPLYELGGKGLFTKEIEQSLIRGEIDFAVHSYKDMPVTMPLVDGSQLVVAAVPRREDPRDAAVMHEPNRQAIPAAARIGTSSLRRRCQILELVPDAQVVPLRGNIDTRIRKSRDGAYDVIILAMAGLMRAGLFESASMFPLEMVPAAGQGALAVQCRKDDARTRSLLAPLNHQATADAVAAERAIVAGLNGDCHSPIAALATCEESLWTLQSAVGAREGKPPVLRSTRSGKNLQLLVQQMLLDLREQGADKLLHVPR
jgi:hydroxymethylbilane synthase